MKTLILFFCCIFIYTNQMKSQSQLFNLYDDWKPYKKHLVKDSSNFNGKLLSQNIYKEKNVKKNNYNSEANIQYDWEKLDGPEGGAVRKIYKYDDEYYCITDREAFKYFDNKWHSLNFGDN